MHSRSSRLRGDLSIEASLGSGACALKSRRQIGWTWALAGANIPPMTLTELRYIVALAEEQHFGRAAERCHVSQPTLSIAVKKLEEELGVLFERGKQKILPTPLGKRIVGMAQSVLEQAAAIKDVAEADKDQ